MQKITQKLVSGTIRVRTNLGMRGNFVNGRGSEHGGMGLYCTWRQEDQELKAKLTYT